MTPAVVGAWGRVIEILASCRRQIPQRSCQLLIRVSDKSAYQLSRHIAANRIPFSFLWRLLDENLEMALTLLALATSQLLPPNRRSPSLLTSAHMH